MTVVRKTKDKTQKPARQGRPPVYENAKEKILAQAAKHFAQSGYENSSINDLAKSLKVSKAAIYHYYPTKQEIYDAIIVNTLDSLMEAVKDEVEKTPEPRYRLRSFMVAHARFFEKNYWNFLTMLMGFSGMERGLRRNHALKARDSYEGYLREIITGGMDDGAFRHVEVATVSRAVLSMLNWMARWFKPEKGASAEQVALDYYGLLISGLGGDEREHASSVAAASEAGTPARVAKAAGQ
ncbi:TetR/AcrR family transcriptional regulator [Ensifer sp. ENS04]|uniref:TetR/AcrR family transcriptional regulator n=1 Tax=Ensifer sp. ENS04 TaxID=2769281 RepID=UPI001785A88F|nr:TetR/AcrR family transcriptional regulator [Ensifer sp. ENS04]MBD9541481.1 TetR/AcrR family transcriptional regulator [Ensifer sp. ENS04]